MQFKFIHPMLLTASMLAATAAYAESTAIISVNAQGQAANGISDRSAISPDGNWVAYQSSASDLVAGDTSNQSDIFLYDRSTTTTTRISLGLNGAQSDGLSSSPRLSQNGRFIAFESLATNLVVNDTGNVQDIFVYDRTSGNTVRVSISSTGAAANNHCLHPALSGDGRFVVFVSAATNLTTDDANSLSDVFLHDRDPDQNGVFDENYGSTIRITQSGSNGALAASSNFPAISRNGQYVAFSSSDSTLVPGDTNGLQDIFVYNIQTGVTERVSVSNSGQQSDGESIYTSLSDDGRYIAFISSATNLVSNDTNSKADVFVRDRVSGTTVRASVSSSGTQAGGSSTNPVISGDGRYVSFATESSALTARLVGEEVVVPVVFDAVTAATGGGGGGTTIPQVIYRRDLVQQITARVSSNSSGTSANASSTSLAMSTDGMTVVFASDATNLSGTNDSNAQRDIFVRDMTSSAPISTKSGGGGAMLIWMTVALLILRLGMRYRLPHRSRRNI